MGRLYEALQRATSEEDVKDIYIKHLGLKGYQKNLIDIQTEQVWFEAKLATTNVMKMFAQQLCYVREARSKGETIPPFLCVIDQTHAAIIETQNVLTLITNNSYAWPRKERKSASAVSDEFVRQVSSYVGSKYTVFDIATQETAFIETLNKAISCGKIIKIPITKDNFQQIFLEWCDTIGLDLLGKDADINDLILLYYADIMNTGKVSVFEDLPAQLLFDGETPSFFLNGKLYKLKYLHGYHNFWSIYERPPRKEDQLHILSHKHVLVPLNIRMFNGNYFTPLIVVNKAYSYLKEVLGDNWEQEYIVWDMCCGVGNLEVRHKNYSKLFMSTLEATDVNLMKSTKTCSGAEIFQYDYLNDDIAENGEIDYSISNKIPMELQNILKDKTKKILVLINPPYGEATNFSNIASVHKKTKAKNKKDISNTKVKNFLMKGKYDYKKANIELYAQFLARIAKEIPNVTLAMFSSFKYISAEAFGTFRNKWNAQFQNGFLCSSTLFQGPTGKFPIGFLVWQTNQETELNFPKQISIDVFNKNEFHKIGQKVFYASKANEFLNKWFKRSKANKEAAAPLGNGLVLSNCKEPLCLWSDKAIAYLHSAGNDFQHAEQMTTLYSSVFGSSHGFYVNPENFEKAILTFCARRIEKPTWLNDRDQFYAPYKDLELSPEFILDSVIWFLFNRCNKTVSAEIEWREKTYKLENHFNPFTVAQVGANFRFHNDFMRNYLAGKVLSKEAKKVYDNALEVYRLFYTEYNRGMFTPKERLEWQLKDTDLGWYQIRKALEAHDLFDLGSAKWKTDYLILQAKLRKQYYEYGFLR